MKKSHDYDDDNFKWDCLEFFSSLPPSLSRKFFKSKFPYNKPMMQNEIFLFILFNRLLFQFL